MSFRLARKSVTLNELIRTYMLYAIRTYIANLLKRRNGRYIALFH